MKCRLQMKNIQSTISEFQHESNMWKRKLADLLLENAYLKNRLAEKLNEGYTTRNFLELAEQYLNRFIRKDEIINLIRHDITVYDKLLTNSRYKNNTLLEKLEQKNDRMRRELQMLDTKFNILKTQFDNFLGDKPWALP